MNQVFTTEQLLAKGITAKQMRVALRQCEARVNAYVQQYLANGMQCSAGMQSGWDAECARHDHLKATLARMA